MCLMYIEGQYKQNNTGQVVESQYNFLSCLLQYLLKPQQQQLGYYNAHDLTMHSVQIYALCHPIRLTRFRPKHYRVMVGPGRGRVEVTGPIGILTGFGPN